MPVAYSIHKPVNSPIHDGLDPRTKLVWLLTLFALSLCFNHPAMLAALCLGVGVVGWAAHLRIRDYKAALLLAAWLMTLSVAIWPAYIEEGALLGMVGPFSFTDTGLLFGAAMGLRISLMLLAAMTWMMTTSPQEINAGLLAMGMPFKAGLAMSSAIRFIPFMNSERITILEAQRARGLDTSTRNPFKALMRTAPVLIPLFSRAFITVRQLTLAMDARGFAVHPERTAILELDFRRVDRILMILAAVAVLLGLVGRVTGVGILVRGLL